MRKDKKELADELSLAMVVVLLALAFTTLQTLYHPELIPQRSLKLTEYPVDCSNLSLPDTAYCLRDELKTFYHFNRSNVGKDLTFEQLVKEGGVCTHYSDWYSQRMSALGFYVKIVDMDVDLKSKPKIGHEIAIASNREAYCVLDQDFVSCMGFEPDTFP